MSEIEIEELSYDEFVERLMEGESELTDVVKERLSIDCEKIVNKILGKHPMKEHLEIFVSMRLGPAVGAAGTMCPEALQHTVDGFSDQLGPQEGDTIQ